MANQEHGGAIVADILYGHGARFLFTLCGGHISPILTGAADRGLRVVDVRDEANAVFAADAVARMTGTVGVAAVTAGPGVTNTITAIKNAQMAQTPLVLLGGATPTLLKGRGSLQDIDQLSLMRPLTKMAVSVSTVPAIRTTLERAVQCAKAGVPGPVFIELPVDLLYPEDQIREQYEKEAGVAQLRGVARQAVSMAIRAYLYRQFHAPVFPELAIPEISIPNVFSRQLQRAAKAISEADRPLIVIGNQTMVGVKDPHRIARAIEELDAPVYLGGAARGLLGRRNSIQYRHARSKALKEADTVVVCGFPFDFRLGYGRGFNRFATVVAANLSSAEMTMNRTPDIAVEMHPGEFLVQLSHAVASHPNWHEWKAQLARREKKRDAEIAEQASQPGKLINPLDFFLRLEEMMDDDAILAVDGGDFVATASYIVRPRAPLSWLDPGVFGTLGVGGGFALGAGLARPGREVWLIWGDGSSAYSLAEFDTFIRHGVAPICVIGNDASWGQIAREQVDMLGTALGTELRRTDYEKVAEGYGGVGLVLDDAAQTDAILAKAKRIAKSGKPVCINVHLRVSDFRKGSISM